MGSEELTISIIVLSAICSRWENRLISLRNAHKHRHRTSHAVFSTQLYLQLDSLRHTTTLSLKVHLTLHNQHQRMKRRKIFCIWSIPIHLSLRERNNPQFIIPESNTRVSQKKMAQKQRTKCQSQPNMNSMSLSMSSLTLMAEAVIQKQHGFMLRQIRMTGIDLHLKQISLAPTEDMVHHLCGTQRVQ